MKEKNINTDITWRDISEDNSVFLPENKERQILVETEITLDISMAKYVDKYDNYLKTRDERVIRYSFID
jgi:hypothetical protein